MAYDLEAEVDLNLRSVRCPVCQKEVDRAVALSLAYIAIQPMDPSLGALLETMSEQANILDSVQERCCRGGN